MKKTTLLTLLFFTVNYSFACSCRVDHSFGKEFYDAIKVAFVGKIEKIVYHGKAKYYEVEVKRIFKGNIKNKLTIKDNGGNSVAACSPVFQEGETYLINPYKTKEGYAIDRCQFNRALKDKNFYHDTLFLHFFSQENVFVNLPEFNGKIVNKKMDGKWHFYRIRDSIITLQKIENYKNGELIDTSFNYTPKGKIYSYNIYKNGKIITTTAFWNDSIRLTSNYKIFSAQSYDILSDTSYLYCKTNLLSTKICMKNNKNKTLKEVKLNFIGKGKAIVFYPNGNIKEKIKINSNGYLSTQSSFYDINKKKSKQIVSNNYFDINYYDWFDLE